uniref:Putative salivary protein gsg7 n=1 Tax=Anopheles darlingi TaxID=43151 RepID=A0A2M4CL47_ANODA
MAQELHWLVGLRFQFDAIDATHEHANKVTNIFRRVKQDKTKNAVYLDSVHTGVKTLLKDPLVSKAMLLPAGTKISDDCLNALVDEAREHENKFYADFTYNCEGHIGTSYPCLEKGRETYYENLKALEASTAKCCNM